MKHMFMETAGEGKQSAGGAAENKQADLAKVIEDSFKGLRADLNKLNNKVDAAAAKKQAPEPKVEAEDDLSTLILVDPAKAVSKITDKIKKEVTATFSSQSSAKDEFNNKFMELYKEYPEISDQGSELHQRAKEIMATITDSQFDSGALERAVYRAASEKGITPMKHRKNQPDGDDSGEYLGSGSSGEGRGNSGRNKNRADKLPAATLAFAEAVGMNTKDPKVVERLTNRHNERKSNWSRYR